MPDTSTLHSERTAQAAAIGASIEVRQDHTTRMLVIFFAALVAAIVAGLWLGTFSRQEPVRGFVSAKTGMLRMTSPGAGSITTITVGQGDFVRQGQTLMTVKSQLITASSGKATTGAIEQQNIERRRTTLSNEIKSIDALISKTWTDRASLLAANASVVQSLDAQERQLRTALRDAEDFLVKLKNLMSSRDVTRERVSNQERSARDYQRQLFELQTRRTENMREHTQRLTTLDVLINDKTNQKTAFANELAALDTELDQSKARGEYNIVASRDGIVASIPVALGASVEANDVLAVMGDPAAEQVLVLEVPAKAMGLIRAGQRVVVKYDAFPYKTFGVKGGTIASVPSAPIDVLAAGSLGPQSAVLAQSARQTTFQVLVKPDTTTVMAYGTARRVALGSTLTADIVIERRRLIDWVIDPILALRGRT